MALAAIYEGSSRSDTARLGNVTLQIVRNSVSRFNLIGPEGLIDGKAPRPRSRLNDVQRAALAKAIRGPTSYLDEGRAVAAVRSGPMALVEFRVSVSKQTLSREVRVFGNRTLAARPKDHEQDPQAIEELKTSLPQWRRLRAERHEENE